MTIASCPSALSVSKTLTTEFATPLNTGGKLSVTMATRTFEDYESRQTEECLQSKCHLNLWLRFLSNLGSKGSDWIARETLISTNAWYNSSELFGLLQGDSFRYLLPGFSNLFQS
jgi:hypothetical protein